MPSDTIGFRCGEERVRIIQRLTQEANFALPSHFIKALIDRLDEIIDGPFDVRDINLATSSHSEELTDCHSVMAAQVS
jgi:hypothetical protein